MASRLTQTQPGIRILLMSGYPNEAMRHGVPPGASLLQKRSTPSLARAVRQVLDARRGPPVLNR